MRLILGVEQGADLGLGPPRVHEPPAVGLRGHRRGQLGASGCARTCRGCSTTAPRRPSCPSSSTSAIATWSPRSRPQPPPLRWSFSLDAKSFGPIRALGERLLDDRGAFLGTIFVYGSTLPASVLSIVARGDIRNFRRMAELTTPGRRSAAILFADVEGSTDRSRRLPSARYFDLIVQLNTAIDEAILGETRHRRQARRRRRQRVLPRRPGRVDLRRRPRGDRAARAPDRARSPASLEGDWRIKVGLHWGATLYMGQDRHQRPARGDRTGRRGQRVRAHPGGRAGRRAARLQAAARAPRPRRRRGARARPGAARPTAWCGELPGAGEKARRDAGNARGDVAGRDAPGSSSRSRHSSRPTSRTRVSGEPTAARRRAASARRPTAAVRSGGASRAPSARARADEQPDARAQRGRGERARPARGTWRSAEAQSAAPTGRAGTSSRPGNAAPSSAGGRNAATRSCTPHSAARNAGGDLDVDDARQRDGEPLAQRPRQQLQREERERRRTAPRRGRPLSGRRARSRAAGRARRSRPRCRAGRLAGTAAYGRQPAVQALVDREQHDGGEEDDLERGERGHAARRRRRSQRASATAQTTASGEELHAEPRQERR